MQMLKMSRKGYLTEAARRKKELEKEKEKISANMEYIRREIRELDEKRDRIMQQQDGMNIGTRERSTEDLLELRIDRVKRRRELTDTVLAVVLLGGIAGTGCWQLFRAGHFQCSGRRGNCGDFCSGIVFSHTAQQGAE